MAKISQIMADMDKVNKGVWVDYAEGIRLLIANINNTEYKKATRKILSSKMRQIRMKSLADDTILELVKPAVARYVLLGWENIEDENGNKIPYSTEKALEFFQTPSLFEFYQFVLESAGDSANIRKELADESEKN